MPTPAYLIELLVELAELGHLLHDLFPHEEGCVEHRVVLTVQDTQRIVDQGLLQKHQWPLDREEERRGGLLC